MRRLGERRALIRWEFEMISFWIAHAHSPLYLQYFSPGFSGITNHGEHRPTVVDST
jgi:hypothetical protein